MPTLRSQFFTASGTFNVPAGVTSVFLTMTGGGGGGGPMCHAVFSGGSGGGAGEFCINRPVKVTAGAAIAVTIVSGGSGGSDCTNSAANGGETSFGVYKVRGGNNGITANNLNFASTAGHGGGYRGGDLSQGGVYGPSINGLAAVAGTAESPSYYGGSSGAGIDVTKTVRLDGAFCQEIQGGVGQNGTSCGSGGGASLFGTGGSGGLQYFPGNDPPAGSYGAGAGGAGNWNFSVSQPGGTGRSGAVLVQWIA